MKYKCKCGNEKDFVGVIRGSQVGLYCKACGKWIKWLDKEEQKLFYIYNDEIIDCHKNFK